MLRRLTKELFEYLSKLSEMKCYVCNRSLKVGERVDISSRGEKRAFLSCPECHRKKKYIDIRNNGEDNLEWVFDEARDIWTLEKN